MDQESFWAKCSNNTTKFPPLDDNFNSNHPNYHQLASQRRQIRKWKMRNRRNEVSKENKNQVSNDVATKKELRRIKNRESAAESRKRKIAEVEEARQAIELLNQENISLRHRLIQLEQTVKTFKTSHGGSVLTQQSIVKTEPIFCSQEPSNISLQYPYQQAFISNKLQNHPNNQSSNCDIFGLDDLNGQELDDLLGPSNFDFSSW